MIPTATLLRFGYTTDDLDRLARYAATGAISRALAYRDRYDTAWSATATAIYEADDAPTRDDLLRVGRRAIQAETEAMRRTFGVDDAHGANRVATSPRFMAYWTPLPGRPVEIVAERIAVSQIIPTLMPTERAAVEALAEYGDYLQAADALGIRYHTFLARMMAARQRFQRRWFAPETPPPIKGCDRRIGSYSRPPETHCHADHEWTPENTRWAQGAKTRNKRVCRACEADRDRKKRAAKQQARQRRHPPARDGRPRAPRAEAPALLFDDSA